MSSLVGSLLFSPRCCSLTTLLLSHHAAALVSRYCSSLIVLLRFSDHAVISTHCNFLITLLIFRAAALLIKPQAPLENHKPQIALAVAQLSNSDPFLFPFSHFPPARVSCLHASKSVARVSGWPSDQLRPTRWPRTIEISVLTQGKCSMQCGSALNSEPDKHSNPSMPLAQCRVLSARSLTVSFVVVELALFKADHDTMLVTPKTPQRSSMIEQKTNLAGE